MLLAEFEEVQRAMAFPTIKQKCILGSIWVVSAFYGLTVCFPDKVLEDVLISFANLHQPCKIIQINILLISRFSKKKQVDKILPVT